MIPIHQRLLDINEEQSIRFENDESARVRNWAKHPTFLAGIKCMDGRVNFSLLTKSPLGSVKAFCAIGGKFEIWWPSFVGRVRHWIDRARTQGCRSVMFVTYHYSVSDTHLGCAGWAYDTAAARAHAEKLRNDLEAVFGEQLTAIVAGVETDHDVLVLHSASGDVSGETCVGKSEEEVRSALMRAFPRVDIQAINDIAPLIIGNALRVEEIKKTPRTLEAKGHLERVIAIGQGFNWLINENVALMINDADPGLGESIRVAASIIQKNLSSAAVGDDATIFTQIPYRQSGIDRRQAVARAKGIAAFAEKIITDAYPELMSSGRMHILSSVMWEPSKRIEIIPE
jgi:hypothetical protein